MSFVTNAPRAAQSFQVSASVPCFPLPIVGAELTVPLVTGGRARYANLDYAASAPCLASVRDAVEALLPWYSSVHRGAGFASTVINEVYAAAREAIGTFVGARPDDAVVFTRNTTDALNLLAAALPADTTVVTFATEHHANLLPWRRGRFEHLPVPRSPEEAVALADRALARLGSGPKLLAVTGASNVTGELWPVAELGATARRHGARLAVDAAQLAPHRRIDLTRLGADYLALSGHKLYAPFGCGVLVGRADWLDAAPPYLAGGGAVKQVALDSVEWAEGAARHEAGTPNVVGAVALGAACAALTEVGMDAVAAHEARLLDRLLRGVADRRGATVLSAWGSGSPRIGVVTLDVRDTPAGLVAAALSAEHGIGVRDGAFCAHPFVGALTGGRAALRASFGAGSSVDDIDRFIAAFDAIVARGPRHRYRLEGGRWLPDPDPRPRPALAGLLGVRLDAVKRGAAISDGCSTRG